MATASKIIDIPGFAADTIAGAIRSELANHDDPEMVEALQRVMDALKETSFLTIRIDD